ncbi:MAG: RagB/SusD family nutrient uptake outer membrane protein [Candidatus Kapabacteria bacterium]|nr:RagB/SusD family nutrient uptake outer membrane protein [Candidatus Kapabacteria bacterium]
MKSFQTLKIGLSALVLTLIVSACANLLNVEPVTTIDGSTDLKSELSVKVALTGAYDQLSNGFIYGGEQNVFSELLGDDGEIRFRGTFAYLGNVWRKQILPLDASATTTWMNSYVAINRVNRILSVIDTLLPADRNSVRGQALFIRGAVYFELVRLYGKAFGDGNNATNLAVPLVTTPLAAFSTGVITQEDSRARNTVAEVYAQVVSDLTTAESLMSATSDGTRANKAVAAALLSRVYLMMGDYANARDAANRVIATNRYTLASNYIECFREALPGFSGETIFRLPILEQDGVNSANTYYSATPGGRRDMEVLTKHMSLYETGDARATMFFLSSGRRLSSKWVDQYGDMPLFRIAEMYLTRAEANYRLGTEVGATPLDDVNRIRTRVKLPALTSLTLAAILKERKLELAFEGHLLHDLKRTRTNISATLPFSANNLVFPIPQREIDVNKNLVQNPGY